MSWKQVVTCHIDQMGNRPNYCLQNVRLAYDIPPLYADAKSAMNASKHQGTFHETNNLDDIPNDVAIPIFVDTGSPYGHVMIDYYGRLYSDGSQTPSLGKGKLLGWSETLNDVRIVEWVETPVPKPEPTPAPTPEPEFKVGDVVVPTRLVDYNGTPLVQYDPEYTIMQINGDRAVLTARGAIWAAMNTKDIRKV